MSDYQAVYHLTGDTIPVRVLDSLTRIGRHFGLHIDVDAHNMVVVVSGNEDIAHNWAQIAQMWGAIKPTAAPTQAVH